MFIASNSTESKNKYGEIGHPCLTPLAGKNQSEISPLLIIAVCILVYKVLMYFLNFGPKLKALRL